jgi:hypothetical protein
MSLTNFNISKPALRRVPCRVRRGTLPMFYGMNAFRLQDTDLLMDRLSYLGYDRRVMLRKVGSILLSYPLEHLFIRLMTPPLYLTLLAIESFEVILAQEDLGLATDALQLSLFKGPRSSYALQLWCRGYREFDGRGARVDLYSNGFDVAGRLGEQDWQSNVN